MTIWLDLMLNLSLLVALSVVSGFINLRWPRDTRPGVTLQGGLFGAATVFAMLRPLDMGGGLIFDGRTVMISLCCLYFGPWAAPLAAGLPLILRLHMGGSGAIMGVSTILAAAAIGLLARARMRPEASPPSAWKLYLLGLAVHLSMVALMTTLPRDIIFSTMARIGPPVLLLYPLATILAGKILSDQIRTQHYIAQLQQARENLAVTLQSIGDAVIATDGAGRISLMNPVAEALTGWQSAEAQGQPLDTVLRLIDARTREPLPNPALQALDSDVFARLSDDTLLVARDGAERRIADSIAPIQNSQGRNIGLALVFRDVTEEHQARESLRNSETFLSTLLDTIPVPVFYKDQSLRFLGFNRAFEAFYGQPRDTIIGKTVFEVLSPELAALHHEKDAQLLANPRSLVYESLATDAHGARHNVIFHKATLVNQQGEATGIIGAALDITERHQASEALRVSTERLQGILDHSPLLIGEIDLNGRYRMVNPAQSRLMGRSASQIIGKAFDEMLPPETAAQFLGRIEQMTQCPEPMIVEDTLMVDGVERYFQSTLFPLFDDQGRLRAVGSIAQDITERKQAEEALRATEAKQRAMIANIADVIAIIDRDGVNRYKSPNIEKWFGWRPEEVVGVSTWDNVHPDDQEAAQQVFASLLQAPDATGAGECRYRCKDGGYKWMEYTAVNLLHYPAIQGVLLNYHDISERKRAQEAQEKLEEQLRQSQKIESVGRLAGGVAHDFNNMLGVILGHAEFALDKIASDHPIHDDLAQIQKAAQRSAQLTRQLLAFARRQTIAPRTLDLNETVEGMLQMLRRLIGEDIDLVWAPDTALWAVRMDPTQIDQILANLCVNARDAISGVGKVTIETTNVTLDATYCADHAESEPGQFVRLAISDDGQGMDRKTLEHIFEPFFTTKAVGQGVGLGLATVYGIVKQNQGFINVYSEPGLGTSFHIYLPRDHATAVKESDSSPERPIQKGSETVLLVEDESAILNMTRRFLESLGYHVLAAGSPSQAIALAREHRGAIHLLMTDVVMPEMNGRDLAGQIQSCHPDIDLLFMSGYTANVIAHHGVLDPGVRFLQKPFSLQALAAIVREALHRPKKD